MTTSQFFFATAVWLYTLLQQFQRYTTEKKETIRCRNSFDATMDVLQTDFGKNGIFLGKTSKKAPTCS